MGPFGASHYSLSFFIPFYPKLPPSDDKVRPEVTSLAGAWKGVGLTFFLLKGLKRTSKTLKLMGDAVDGHGKKDVPSTGTSGTSGIDKGACRTLTPKNPVTARPVKSPNSAGYGLRKISRSPDQVSSHTRACKSDTLGISRGERSDVLVDSLEGFSESALYETATSSSAGLRYSTAESLRGFGLGLEGVMTTITGLSQQADYKNEVKGFITVVKTADRVVEGVKAAKGVIQTFSSPLGDALHVLGAGGSGVVLGLNTVKIVLKGVKISKGLITVTKLCKNRATGAIGTGAEIAIKAERNLLGQHFSTIVKGLKASEGAANVVNTAKEFGKTLGMLDKVDLLSWSVAMKGFKLTKSALRVLEPLGSLPMGVISALREGILEMKGAVEGVGVVVKAIVLSQELYLVLLKGIGFTKGAMAAFHEFNRRLLLTKGFPEPLAGSAEEYSQRTEVRFCYDQQLAMPSVIWSLTEAESKHLRNGWEFISYSCPTKELDIFTRTQESLGDVEGTDLLQVPILTLALCFNFESCSEVPTQPG